MGSFIKQIRYVAVVVLCAVVFTLVTNCWNNDQARKWQVDSEDLIWGRIIQMQLGEKDTGFLGRYGAAQKNGYLRDCFREGEIPQGEWNSYTHQSGLQGTLFGFVNLIFESFSLGGKIRWAALRFGNSVLYVFPAVRMDMEKAGAFGGFDSIDVHPVRGNVTQSNAEPLLGDLDLDSSLFNLGRCV